LGLGALAVLLLLGGGWLSIPGPSHLFDTLQSACRLSDSTTVRFYEGNGGATTSFSYSVTVQPTPWPWTERLVFYSYGSPTVTQVTCAAGTLTITAVESNWSVSEVTGVTRVQTPMTWSLSSADIASRPKPAIMYYRSKPAPNLVDRGNWGPLEIVRTFLGASMCLAGVLLLWRTRRLPNKPLERPGINARQPIGPASAGRSAPSR
jgi:hypothetical protein